MGLPPQGDNQGSKAQAIAALGDPTAVTTQAQRQFAFDVAKEFLRIRKSSALFRLRTADQIKSRLSMLNTGPSQQAGVVAYRLDGCASPDLPGQPYGAVVTIINPTTNWTQLQLFKDENFALHPVQAGGVDAVVKTATHDSTAGFRVPPRTTAVFVKSTQSSCSPYGVPIFVRGLAGDWSANPARELTYTGGVAYARDIAVVTGAQQFKIADNDWTSASNCGAGAGGLSLQVGKPAALLCDASSGNIDWSPPAAGDYTFSLDATSMANPVLTVGKVAPFGATTLYVRGIAGDWGTTNSMKWDGVGTYRAEILNLAAGASQFKIADADWGGNNGGASNCGAGATATVTVGTPFALNCNNSSGNLEINLATAGSYLFAVDGSNPAALTLTVEKLPYTAALFVRGLDADWTDAATNRMAYLGGGVYKYSKKLGVGAQQFKIADSGWTDGTNCGTGTAVTPGTPVTLACAGPGNDNIPFNVAAAGYYDFLMNATAPAAPVLTVNGP